MLTEDSMESRGNTPIKFLMAGFREYPGFPKQKRVVEGGCTREGHCSLPLEPPSIVSTLSNILFWRAFPEF